MEKDRVEDEQEKKIIQYQIPNMKSIQVQTVNYQTKIKMKQAERRNKRNDSTQYHIPNKSSM